MRTGNYHVKRHEGERFGRLVVLRRDVAVARTVKWIVRCDCGAETSVYGSFLRGGRTRSCGCLRRELGVAHGRASVGQLHRPAVVARRAATMRGVPRKPESVAKAAAANRGKKRSAETRMLLSKIRRGTQVGLANPAWRGGVTPEHVRLRGSSQMSDWRKAVFARDEYACVNCGARGVRLNADHIKPFATYAGLRFDISNGRTLCVPCHRRTPTYGNKKKGA